MKKRKRTKQEIVEESRREAENLPSVRRLRELYERGMADLRRREAEQQRG